MLIKPYSADVKFANFPELEHGISKYYDHVYDTVPTSGITPRYYYEAGLKIGFRDVFYYIDQLYNTAPADVIDVGCGENVWKKWFPHIIGFDPRPSQHANCDFVAEFDQQFSVTHTGHWDCGMALNSIHFVDWSQIPSQIDRAMNLVKQQFLFTFNFFHFQNAPDSVISKFDHVLQSLDYNIELLDYPVLRGVPEHEINKWKHINGNVRFILSHPTQSKDKP
jgi:hypothetical protein